jgi:hypothetical protein
MIKKLGFITSLVLLGASSLHAGVTFTGGDSDLVDNSLAVSGSQSHKLAAFTVGSSAVTLEEIGFYAKVFESSTTVTLSLLAGSYSSASLGGQTLTGLDLLTGTVTVPIDSIGYEQYTLTLDSPITLAAGATYFLVIGNSDAILGTTINTNLTGTTETPLAGLFRDETGTAGGVDGSVSSSRSIAYNLVTSASIPEPSSALLGCAGALVLLRRRRA